MDSDSIVGLLGWGSVAFVLLAAAVYEGRKVLKRRREKAARVARFEREAARRADEEQARRMQLHPAGLHPEYRGIAEPEPERHRIYDREEPAFVLPVPFEVPSFDSSSATASGDLGSSSPDSASSTDAGSSDWSGGGGSFDGGGSSGGWDSGGGSSFGSDP